MEDHVTKRTRPDLNWHPHPKGFYVADELIRSDAYRSLSKVESELLLFIFSRRQYPSRKRKANKKTGAMDYWNPLNGHYITIPYKAVKEFFHKPGGMEKQAPNDSTISRGINKLMHVGFLSVIHLGGNGKGDMTIYRLENNWRVWREGDEACFTKAGMSHEKGFCKPGSGIFCPLKNGVKN